MLFFRQNTIPLFMPLTDIKCQIPRSINLLGIAKCWNSNLSFVMNCMLVSTPKIYVLNPTSQCDGIKRWSLWEIIRIRWGLKGGTLINGISTLIGVTREYPSLLCSSAKWGYKEKLIFCTLEGDPHQNSTKVAPWTQTSSLQNYEK